MSDKQTYVALLRGINVGGHHKVPMADLRREMGKLGFDNVVTLLNSGNIIFDGTSNQPVELEEKIANHLERVFEFPIPVLIRKAERIMELSEENPFSDIEVTNDIRLYITFLKETPGNAITLPWISDDESYRIIDIQDRAVCSVLDLSISRTTEAMKSLGQFFGNEITTRNWNTINRIIKKLS
jgi:uncharacterized protein (DUF1697 family)